MDRRAFITLLATGFVGLGCQAAKPSSRRAIADDDTGPPEPTQAIPKPIATPKPLGQPAPVPTSDIRTFSTRTLPPNQIIIPTINLDSKIVPLGTTVNKTGSAIWETAAFAVGFHRGSANPGEPGNVVLSGHISSPHEGAVFNKLPNLKVGDGVIIATPERHFIYLVSDIQTVKPNAVEVLNSSTSEIATLITCVPDGVYSHRLIVRCDLV